MDDEHVRVDLERSGGFTGLRRCASMDTDALSEQDAGQLRDIVATLDLDAITRLGADPRLPTVELTFVRGTERVHATLDESTVPTHLRPLIQLLDQRAQPC